MTSFNESTVEQGCPGVALQPWLGNSPTGRTSPPEPPPQERDNYTEVVLERRLRDPLERLNPDLDDGALETALRRITNPDGPTQEGRNRSFHLEPHQRGHGGATRAGRHGQRSTR